MSQMINPLKKTLKAQRNARVLLLYSCPWRPSWLIIVLLFLSSCSTVRSVSEQPVITPKPALAFEEQVYDFGIAGPEQKIKHAFKFINTGSEPLKIIKLSPSCGCTAALSSEDEVPPGGSGEIQAILETRKYAGRQEASIVVHSNDPLRPETVLTLKGNIRKGLAVVPQGVSFGNIQKGETAAAQVRILQLSKDPLVLEKIEANDKFLTVETSKFSEENSRGINIDIMLKPDIPAGMFSEVITLHTNLKKYQRIDVPVIANILEND